MSTTFDVNGNPIGGVKQAAGKVFDLDMDEIDPMLSKSAAPVKPAIARFAPKNTINYAASNECYDNRKQRPAKENYFAYKGFKKTADGKLTCRDTVYKLGEVYNIDGEIELCSKGFHYCDKLEDVFVYYDMDSTGHVFHRIQILGEYIDDPTEDKKVTNSFKILEEIPYADVVFAAHSKQLERIVNLQNQHPYMYLTGSYALVLSGKIPYRKLYNIDFVTSSYPNLVEYTPEKETLHSEGVVFDLGSNKIESAKITSGSVVSVDTKNAGCSVVLKSGKKSSIEEYVGINAATSTPNRQNLPSTFTLFVEPTVRFKTISLPGGNTVRIQLPEDIMKVKARLYFTNGHRGHKSDLLHYLIHN